MNNLKYELFRTQIDGLIISTINTNDEGLETAILDKNGAYPVERYINEAEAIIGHFRWCSISNSLNCVIRLGSHKFSIKDQLVIIEKYKKP